MNGLRIRTLTLASLLAACGTAPTAGRPGGDAGVGDDVSADVGDAAFPDRDADRDAPPRADAGPGSDGSPDVSDLVDPLALCDPEIAWENQQTAQWMEPTFFEESPNGGLVWAGHYDLWVATLTRVRDGEVVAVSDTRTAIALDRAWSRRVVLGGDGHLEVATTVTDQTLAVLEEQPESWSYRWLAADISDDGRRVAAAGCTEEGFRVQAWEIEPEVRVLGVHDEAYDGEFCQTYDSRPKVVLGDDAVFFSPPATGHVSRWSWDTGRTVHATGSDSPESPDAWPWRAEVADIALSPDGARVAVTGSDGHLRVFSAADLALLLLVDGVRPNLLNEMTYAPPVTASPVAWSPAGTLLATLGDDSDVVLRDAATGDVVRTLPARTTTPDETFGIRDAISGLAFSRDGAALYTLQMYGHTAYTCDGAPPAVRTPDEPLDATIEGPARVTAGVTATFTATHLGHVSVHAHRFFLDGEPLGAGDFERTVQIPTDEPGEHEISVIIDDGARQAEASMWFTIDG